MAPSLHVELVQIAVRNAADIEMKLEAFAREPDVGLLVDEALELPREMKNPTAMVAAIKEKGILSGKRVERSERGAPREFEWIDTATADQLEHFLQTGDKPEQPRH